MSSAISLYLNSFDDPVVGFGRRQHLQHINIPPELTYNTSLPSIANTSSRSYSTASTISQSSKTSKVSRVFSDASSIATSTHTQPQWQPQLPTLNQQLAMVPITYTYSLPCEFSFMGCEEEFHPDNHAGWISHSLTHFGSHPPPDRAICIFCDEENAVFESRNDPYTSWWFRMLHISEHFADGLTLEDVRPDFWLYQYLFDRHLIDERMYAALEMRSERPNVPGLVPLGYETPEIQRRRERDSQMHHDLQREERNRRREHVRVRED